MANGVNDRVFEYLQSAEPDLTFVADERMLPEEVQAEQDWDKKNWDNFSQRLGSLDYYQKRQLKDLWIEGGRPEIKIHKKEGDGKTTKDTNRAWMSALKYDDDVPIDLRRDRINIYEHKLVGDFMAEISHTRAYALKPGEPEDHWLQRRAKMEKRSSQQKKDFEKDRYGGWQYTERTGQKYVEAYKDQPTNQIKRKFEQWFPYMGSSRHYSIGRDAEGNEVAVDDEGNMYPDMAVPQPEIRYNKKGEETGRSRSIGWAYSIPMRATYDPEKRKGWNEQRRKWIKPTQEFEAHSIIEDSLWGDYTSRFGEEFGEYGIGWAGSHWRSDEGREHIQDLIDKGLVE